MPYKLPVARLNIAKKKAASRRFRKKGCKVKVPGRRRPIRTTSAPTTIANETTVSNRRIANFTTASNTTPCPTTAKPSFSFSFFSRFSQVLRGFGLDATVVRKKAC